MDTRPINDVIADMITQSKLRIPEVAKQTGLAAQTIYYIIGSQPRKTSKSERICPKWETVEAIAKACGFAIRIIDAAGGEFEFSKVEPDGAAA